jgi:hypothetical protein
MPRSRYSNDPIIIRRTRLATARSFRVVRAGVKSGQIKSYSMTLTGLIRLDQLAGKIYGSGNYWWAIAAASNIGWGLQVPPGTRLLIPDIEQVMNAVG